MAGLPGRDMLHVFGSGNSFSMYLAVAERLNAVLVLFLRQEQYLPIHTHLLVDAGDFTHESMPHSKKQSHITSNEASLIDMILHILCISYFR